MTQYEQSSIKARNKLSAMFLALCILDSALVYISHDKYSIGRILLTIVLMYFVLQGRKWAKWLLIGICSLVVILLVAMVVKISAKLSTVLIVGSLILAVLNAVIIIYLSTSKDLKLYFSEKMHNYS
jgi:peptidoglycan/LPS O-acetylase OafA/YrhL